VLYDIAKATSQLPSEIATQNLSLHDGDKTARYLPKTAWENMSEQEERATEQKKRE
jgi:hypothetical protein